MPIRFRCAYCNQLMGIAKRKAGQVVTCPKCVGQVVVPTPDPSMVEEEQHPGGDAAAAFEEDEEVQKLLEYVEESKPAPVASAHGQRRQPAAAQQILQMPMPAAAPRNVPQPVVGSTYPADIDVVPLNNGAMPPLVPARGVYLTTGISTILIVLIALLIGLAFFLGFLLGRS